LQPTRGLLGLHFIPHAPSSTDYPTVKDAVFLQEQNRQPRPSDTLTALNTTNIAQTLKSLSCTFCNATGQVVDTCFKFCDMHARPSKQVQDSKLRKAGRSKGKKKSDQANQAEEKAGNVEFAGKASAFIPDYSSPTSALFVEASSDSTADTGASSHMTPHHHWFSSYQPYRVPVRLANGQMIYSAGVGTI
jgi:hypothetical protein